MKETENFVADRGWSWVANQDFAQGTREAMPLTSVDFMKAVIEIEFEQYVHIALTLNYFETASKIRVAIDQNYYGALQEDWLALSQQLKEHYKQVFVTEDNTTYTDSDRFIRQRYILKVKNEHVITLPIQALTVSSSLVVSPAKPPLYCNK